MQPSESSLGSFGFLKVFLDVPPPLSRDDSVPLVANASSVLFILSQVLVHVMASGVAFECLCLIPSAFSLKLMCFL